MRREAKVPVKRLSSRLAEHPRRSWGGERDPAPETGRNHPRQEGRMRTLLWTLVVLASAISPVAAASRYAPGKTGTSSPPGITATPSSTADHNVNEVTVTITDVGAFGYFDPTAGIVNGSGFSFMGGASALFHAGIIMGTSANTVSDAFFGSDDQGADRPFNFASTSTLVTGSTPTIDQYTCSRYDDAEFDVSPLNVEVSQQTYAWAGDSYIIIDLTIRAANALNGLYVGLCADWDIGADVVNNDTVGFDAAHRLSYVSDTGTFPGIFGIELLSHPLSGARAIQNQIYVYPNAADPTIDPGFEDDDKFAFLTDMTVTVSPVPDDVSHLVAAGPFNLAANGEVRIAFAMLAGDTLPDLVTQAQSAQARWNAGIMRPCATFTGVPDRPVAIGARLLENHPNPFIGSTTIEYELDRPASVQLRVYDLSGRMVRELVRGPREAARHRVTWDGNDATGIELPGGIYFCELMGPGLHTTRRIVLGK
jgi:serine protease